MNVQWPDTSSGSCPTVQLWHEVPDGSSHVDWMLAREPEAVSPLLSFRLVQPLHEMTIGAALTAELIQDHRPAYLSYVGPVSGDRGHVRQLATGMVDSVASGADEDEIELSTRWSVSGDTIATVRLRLVPEHDAARKLLIYRVLPLVIER